MATSAAGTPGRRRNDAMKSWPRNLLFVLAGFAFAVAAQAAEVTLRNAWMRPAPAQAETARVYVDIDSGATLELVGASTPVADNVEIVRVRRIGDPASEEVVKAFAVSAGKTTRLAYRGDHLRFKGILRDLANGDPVPLTLVFKAADGREVRATTNVVVRGLLLPRQMPEASRDSATPPPGPPAVPDSPAMPKV